MITCYNERDICLVVPPPLPSPSIPSPPLMLTFLVAIDVDGCLSYCVDGCDDCACVLGDVQMGLRCSFGLATGQVYCGLVGSFMRREYAVVGK